MDIVQREDLGQKNREKDYIHKGRRVLPDLGTAILANLRGYVNGSYPEPLSGAAKELGYYPLSMATEEELAKIEDIKKQVLSEKK